MLHSNSNPVQNLKLVSTAVQFDKHNNDFLISGTNCWNIKNIQKTLGRDGLRECI